MLRQASRIRVGETGELEVIDPGWPELPLLQAIDSSFAVQRQPLRGFLRPKVLSTRQVGLGISLGRVPSLSRLALRAIHDTASSEASDQARPLKAGEASLLDAKIELVRRRLRDCDLCARGCHVDRLAGQLGACALGTDATVAEAFVHIAEEPPINPSLVVSLAGCGLRCRFCQQHRLLRPRAVRGVLLDATLWDELDGEGARSLSFLGGNPDENLFAILRFLRDIPLNWSLPIVWNTHAYVPPSLIGLLDGVVDVYVPDLKYGSDACGRALSGIADYPGIALDAIDAMLAQDVVVIVRMLVLPGHIYCCHLPALRSLAGRTKMKRPLISVRGQYSPDWKITALDGNLARRTSSPEADAVRSAAEALGFEILS